MNLDDMIEYIEKTGAYLEHTSAPAQIMTALQLLKRIYENTGMGLTMRQEEWEDLISLATRP